MDLFEVDLAVDAVFEVPDVVRGSLHREGRFDVQQTELRSRQLGTGRGAELRLARELLACTCCFAGLELSQVDRFAEQFSALRDRSERVVNRHRCRDASRDFFLHCVKRVYAKGTLLQSRGSALSRAS